MVEVWPYTERSRGIAIFQLFGRLSGFFTTFVNPIGLANVGWRYLISYCCWLAFEVMFVYFMFPETFGRTLEELAFSKCSHLLASKLAMGHLSSVWALIESMEVNCRSSMECSLTKKIVFEDKKLADEAVKAAEKALVHDDDEGGEKAKVGHMDAKA